METNNAPDLWHLYKQMLRSRCFERAVARFWQEGRISGEMHMGLGEEAVVAGILDHLKEGDALALDHRGTPPMVMRGIDLVALLKEFLGDKDGLCAGYGGHMHLFSREQLIASSGIVGSSGPAACGFALSAQYRQSDSVAVAFFGDGAVNQGMLLESFNLAAAWKLPVLFVCKDSDWAITTVSATVTAGNILERARGFGLQAIELDGTDVEAVWKGSKELIQNARTGKGPSFVLAHCPHLEGHFLGDPLLMLARNPLGEVKKIAASLLKSATRLKGASLKERTDSITRITSLLGKTAREQRNVQRDPLEITRKKLQHDKIRLNRLEEEVKNEIESVIQSVTLTT